MSLMTESAVFCRDREVKLHWHCLNANRRSLMQPWLLSQVESTLQALQLYKSDSKWLTFLQSSSIEPSAQNAAYRPTTQPTLGLPCSACVTACCVSKLLLWQACVASNMQA